MSVYSSLLYFMAGSKRQCMRNFAIQRALRIEGGEFYGRTIRRIFKDYFAVDVGSYSHGACFVPGALDRHTTVGRYCSIAAGVRVMNRNHPLDFRSTHAFFFNPALGYIKKDPISYIPLDIGNDVWIGTNALIMPNCRKIADGAVVGAGAVVHTDIPPYAVVVGNPGRVVRYRFSQAKIAEILASKWWEKPVDALDLQEFNKPIERESGQNATSV